MNIDKAINEYEGIDDTYDELASNAAEIIAPLREPIKQYAVKLVVMDACNNTVINYRETIDELIKSAIDELNITLTEVDEKHSETLNSECLRRSERLSELVKELEDTFS